MVCASYLVPSVSTSPIDPYVRPLWVGSGTYRLLPYTKLFDTIVVFIPNTNNTGGNLDIVLDFFIDFIHSRPRYTFYTTSRTVSFVFYDIHLYK